MVIARSYVPDTGDIVWISFDPQAGHDPSAVLADQVKSLDWRKRSATRKGTISATELAEVRAKLRALIG